MPIVSASIVAETVEPYGPDGVGGYVSGVLAPEAGFVYSAPAITSRMLRKSSITDAVDVVLNPPPSAEELARREHQRQQRLKALAAREGGGEFAKAKKTRPPGGSARSAWRRCGSKTTSPPRQRTWTSPRLCG